MMAGLPLNMMTGLLLIDDFINDWITLDKFRFSNQKCRLIILKKTVNIASISNT